MFLAEKVTAGNCKNAPSKLCHKEQCGKKMRAFVFPGQGAQMIGMGKALADAYPQAQAVFDEVDAALGEKLSDLIWNGTPE